MCLPLLPAVMIGTALLGAGVSMYQGSRQRAQARDAQQENVDMANRQAQRSEEQFNRLNQNQPGIAALWAKNRNAAAKGLGSTFLTGTKGVPNLGQSLGGSPSLLGA